MKAISIAKPGGFERLRLVDGPDPQPGPGEVLVVTRAVGVNFADVVVRLGLYESAKKYAGWPITPGFEFSGEVAALGSGVTDLKLGERVFGLTRFGGYASHICVPRTQLFRVPAALTHAQAATFPTVFLTAYYALRETFHVRPGGNVLIHAAAGGVGLAALQLCRIDGLTTIAVVGASHKCDVAREYGATSVIDKSTQALWPEVERLAPDGLQLVLDSNGAETLAQGYAHLRPTGRLIVYGFHSMLRRGHGRASLIKLAWDYLRTPRFNPLEMVDANKGVVAFNLSYMFEEQALLGEAMTRLLAELERGLLRPLPVSEFPLSGAGAAHRALQSGATVGKLVLIPDAVSCGSLPGLMTSSRWARRTIGSGALWLAACAPAQPPAPKQATPPVASQQAPSDRAALLGEPEPPVPELRTGRIKPVDHSELLTLKVRRHAIDGDEQLLEILLPDFAAEVPGDSFWLDTEARLTGSSAPFQLVGRGKDAEMLLWLRRPKAESSSELMGDAYTPALGARPGHHFRFRAAAPSGPLAPDLPAAWAKAAVEYLSRRSGVFGTSAAARLSSRYKLPGTQRPSPLDARGGSRPDELAALMDTFSGRSAVQEAIAIRREGVLSAAKQPRTIPLTQLKGPELQRHPWAELSKRLGGKQPEEPLAKAVPAEFFFVRAQSFGAFHEMLSFVESFGGPAAELLDRSSTERGTLPRYLAELGVETSDLSRVLGPEVVQDFAICGSDPYIHEGSDITLIFRLKSPLLFRAALLKALTTHGSAHGGTQSSSFTHEGVTVDVARSANGRVRQHRATVAELELVSNSPGAIKRVISAIQGKQPRLADELDFRYMLARDADVPAELLAFIGDRFVEHVVGPAQKIAQVRRQVALSEQMAAPLAALLYGWIHGKSPVDRNELVRAGLLGKNELAHQDGARIDWAPGSAPRSVWGSPATLEPLIDLPAVTRVSATERDSYAQFSQQYQWRWAQYIDPIALRIASTRRGEGKSLHAELRVLPLVPAEQALRFDMGGDGHVAPPELASGARFSLGIGQKAYLRQGLGQALNLLGPLGPDIQLDWLGDFALVGVADRAELLAASRLSRETRDLAIERPASAEELGRESAVRDDIEALASLPVYAVIGLKSRVAAAVALTALRRAAESSAPGAFEWAPFASHRGVEVVRVMSRERNKELALYYAIAGDVFIVSLNRSVMRSLIEQALDGKLPAQGKPAAALAREGQAVLELAPLKKGALRQLLAWGLTVSSLEAARSSRATAEAVLRGVPESAHKPERAAELSLAYLGVLPVTPDGRRYRLGADGVTDPLRGTAHAPEWPAVPTPESPAARLLGMFGRLRSDLSFDTEPQIASVPEPLRSLRVRLDLWLR